MKLTFYPKASLNRERLAELARLYSTDEGESGAVCLDTESFTYSQEHSEPPEEPEEEPLKPVIKTSPAKADPEHATMRNSGSYYRKSFYRFWGRSTRDEIQRK